MDLEDVKFRSLANLSFTISGIEIQPITLRSIVNIGYQNYSKYLSAVTLEKENLISKEYLDTLPEEVGIYDIVELYGKDDQLYSTFYSGLKLLLKTDEVVYNNGLYIENKKVEANEFKEIIQVIKIQNCLTYHTETEFNPLNEKAKKIKEKMLENQRKIQEMKKNSGNDSDNLSFLDLVSILCSNANGISLFNVFDLNMFQFNDQFNRMKLLNEYEVSVQSLLHGADPKNVELKHWISKI